LNTAGAFCLIKSIIRFFKSFYGRYRLYILLLAALVCAVALQQFLSWKSAIQQESENLPPALPSPIVPETVKQEDGVFEPNQTISEVLAGHGLSAGLVQQIIDCARPNYNLAKVKAGYPYRLRFDSSRWFQDFQYPIDSDRYLIVYRDDATQELVSEVKEFPFEVRVEEVAAVIKSSLFQSIENIGEQDALAWNLEDIFNSDIDFYIDIRKGDSFKVFVEKKYLDGKFSGYGAVLAACFINDGRTIMGFRFEDKNGKPAYFDPDGKSLKKSFLKSPLKYSRISSTFSFGRRHPITKKVQPHLGVDYAAPIGTPVRAVASGRVAMAGRSGNNGNMIRLRHPNGYETMYLHLSRIAVRTGASVSQGEVIGYVGSTGLSTGPHLDFRIQRNGKALNPLKMIFPPGDPVPAEKFEQFTAVRDKWMAKLQSE
jgi:murein DD-endopeptidase MepM/ murein hydrolase activator NlpD